MPSRWQGHPAGLDKVRMSPLPARKIRVCFVLPGVHYTPDNAYVMMIVALFPHLNDEFELTLVCRKPLHPMGSLQDVGYRYLSILSEAEQQTPWEQAKQQNRSFIPTSYFTFHRYKRQLDNFAAREAHNFDHVVEVQWSWLGAVVDAFHQQGIPATVWLEAWWKKRLPQGRREWLKALYRTLGSPLIERYRRRLVWQWNQLAASVITETQEMEKVLGSERYFHPSMPIHNISMGINESIFFPRDRVQSRQALCIDSEATVITYVGSLGGSIQDLSALVEAFCRIEPANTILYLVGDGSRREALEAMAKVSQAQVVFTGRVPQLKAAEYIGAANLCAAPYDLSRYFQDKMTSASLKMPEYLASGRLVITTSCQRMEKLTANGTYGYLLKNNIEDYSRFLSQLPGPSELSWREEKLQQDLASGYLGDQDIVSRWSDIAKKFKAVVQESVLSKDKSPAELSDVGSMMM